MPPTQPWTDVPIPPERLDAVASKECEAWMVDHVAGSAIGHEQGGTLTLRFSDPNDAAAFRERWLS